MCPARCRVPREADVERKAGTVTTYSDGKPVRYPRRMDVVREGERLGRVTVLYDDGCVLVVWDDGEDTLYQPDVLYLHQSGWFWLESEPEEVRGW